MNGSEYYKGKLDTLNEDLSNLEKDLDDINKNIKIVEKVLNRISWGWLDDNVRTINGDMEELKQFAGEGVRSSKTFTSSLNNIDGYKLKTAYSDYYLSNVVSNLNDELNRLKNNQTNAKQNIQSAKTNIKTHETWYKEAKDIEKQAKGSWF